MMSSGLKEDWPKVVDLAAAYVNSIDGDGNADQKVRAMLIAELERLRLIYGDLTIINETLAEYTEDIEKKLMLFDRSFQERESLLDYDGMLSISTSALSACIENNDKINQEVWRWRIVKNLANCTDEWEIQEAKELLAECGNQQQ